MFCYNAKGKLQWSDKFLATEGPYWVAMSHDASWAASGWLLAHGSGFVRAYNAATGVKVLDYTTNARVSRVAISAHGTYLVAGGGATYFFSRAGAVWSAPQVISCATGDSVVSVDILSDGQWIALGTYLGFVSLVRNTGGTLGPPVTWQQKRDDSLGPNGFRRVGICRGREQCQRLLFRHGRVVPQCRTHLDQEAYRLYALRIGGHFGRGSLIAAVGIQARPARCSCFRIRTPRRRDLWNAATLHNPNSTNTRRCR